MKGKKILKEFEEKEGYKFIWETQCTNCYEDFQCQDMLPSRVIKKMLEEKTDDVVAEFVGSTADHRFHHCPQCRKELGED